MNFRRALWIAAVATGVSAQDLPKAEAVLDKYVEVTGGKAAFAKHHSDMSIGTVEFAAMGIKAKLTSYSAEPNKFLAEVTIEGIGKIMEGSNGEVAWGTSAMQGPRVKEGDEKEEALLHGAFNADLRWKELYPKVETVGSEEVDGKECYKLLLTPKSGNPITRWFEKSTGLMVKSAAKSKTAMGEIESTSVFSDYRKEGDVLMPHKVVEMAAGQTIQMTLESVKWNAEIPKDKFDLPAEIQALIKK